jgi:hypothetical protein
VFLLLFFCCSAGVCLLLFCCWLVVLWVCCCVLLLVLFGWLLVCRVPAVLRHCFCCFWLLFAFVFDLCLAAVLLRFHAVSCLFGHGVPLVCIPLSTSCAF